MTSVSNKELFSKLESSESKLVKFYLPTCKTIRQFFQNKENSFWIFSVWFWTLKIDGLYSSNLSVTLSVCLSFFLSFCICLCVFMSHSLSVCLSVSTFLCRNCFSLSPFFLSLSFCFSFLFSFCLFLSLSNCWQSVFLSFFMPVYRSICEFLFLSLSSFVAISPDVLKVIWD